MTPLQNLLSLILTHVQKLLVDPRIGQDVSSPTYDDAAYQNSQFKHLYDSEAYNADKSRRAFTGDPLGTAPFYPLTERETVDLQEVRVLEYIQLGFVPIDNLEAYSAPTLFIANATDRHRVEPASTTLNQVEEIIPLNFRLVTKQPAAYSLEKANIVVVDKVLEGLKYVLSPDIFRNLSFQRRGYTAPTVIRDIAFIQALNLEEFLDPYEVCDYLFHITIREQLHVDRTS